MTNEGVLYSAYTDASGDDFAMYDGSTKSIRFNLGRDTVLSPINMPVNNVTTTGIDTAINGGGYFRSDTHRPRVSGGMLIVVTYRVTVAPAVPYNTIINYGSGTLRYRNQVSTIGATDLTATPNTLSFIVYQNYGLCSNATGANYVSAGSGNFNSGTTENGSNPGTVPDYNFVNITTGNPGDGNYAVVKNLSPNESTNQFITRPESPSLNRVFGVWDIIGDHTNAVDPLAGNPPSAAGINGGYMLAVNAAHRLGVASDQTITGLCEDTYYEFSAWFRNVCKRCGIDSVGRGASNIVVPAGYLQLPGFDSSGIKPNLTFQIDGIDYYLTGDMNYVGTWGQWVKKGFVFKTAVGQTSLTISIKNNAPGGGGNDWVMDDISFASCLPGLTMRPGPSPTFCLNGQVNLSAIISTFYNNYQYYKWERTTDGGASWHNAPEQVPAGNLTFGYTFDGVNYKDTVAMPTFLATAAQNGYQYRIRVATTTSNLSTNQCSIYQDNSITLTVFNTCNVLDIELNDFRGQVRNAHSELIWVAKGDQNVHSFEIEKSSDGVTFTKIATVNGRLSNTAEQYIYTDPETLNGKSFYRLRIVSQGNSNIKYSSIINLSLKEESGLQLKSVVNPFANALKLQISAPVTDRVTIELYDSYGKLIFTKPAIVQSGLNTIAVETPQYLASGIYILTIKSTKETINKTIQKF